MNKAYIFISVIFLTLSASLKAQTDFSLTGLGRVIVTNDKLDGKLLENDTLTPDKGLGGYILFDLKPTLKVGNNLNANAIFRVKNQFGSFFGEGTNFEFRQFQVMGAIGEAIDYQIGDINVEMTPYTVHAFPEMYNKYESEIHRMRREIVDYENFVIGNAWRLQGVQGFADIDFEKGIESIKINAFGVRTNPTNDASTPDRILAGTRAVLKLNDMFSMGGNYVGMLDIPIESAEVEYTNHVVTGDAKFSSDRGNVILSLNVETGFSSYDYFRAADNRTVSYNDYFFDIGTAEVFKPLKLKLFASYKDIGPQFSSPSAQTRRINIGTTPELFSKVINNTTNRTQVLFDRFTQENIYNRGINPVLYAFLPLYNNISPYGAATPNRRGFTAGLASDTSIKVFSAEVRADILTEVIGEGTPDVRNFLGITGGILFDVAKLAKMKKRFTVNAGARYENTTRAGLAPVDFTSTLIDAGASVEIIKKIDFLIGAKLLMASGTEFLSIRNDFNELSSFPAYTIDMNQNVLSLGGRIRFAEKSYFTINYNISTNKDNLTSAMSYDIKQLFFNYTIIIP